MVSVLLTGGVAWGQGTAELAGRVTDASGAVLPGVTVTVTQTNTGFTRTVVTDATGQWVMPALPTGPYRLEVSLQGFRTYVQTGIVLQVGGTPTINAAIGHRVDQLSDDVYGAKTLDAYLNRAAFANPGPGGFGNHLKGSIQGPGYRSVDVAASRLFPLGAAHTIEVRVEAFNLFNTFNWGDPETRLRSANFGKITEENENGAPRIMQFGIKYGF